MKERTTVPPPGIEAEHFNQVATAYLRAVGRPFLEPHEGMALVEYLRRWTPEQVCAAIARAQSVHMVNAETIFKALEAA